ncbi:hypothetical protein Y032_0009g565 [Ancylostoma ceylanicum]|uniref:Uncharacterized protein n=1 Tax=Ancylostoma ceylanicum TaxID=53326 RepID=A0A016VJH8_9BILA|nr:hypothetical protein Y032_0009g565 [Ancylostoma ceylanicum]
MPYFSPNNGDVISIAKNFSPAVSRVKVKKIEPVGNSTRFLRYTVEHKRIYRVSSWSEHSSEADSKKPGNKSKPSKTIVAPNSGSPCAATLQQEQHYPLGGITGSNFVLARKARFLLKI